MHGRAMMYRPHTVEFSAEPLSVPPTRGSTIDPQLEVVVARLDSEMRLEVTVLPIRTPPGMGICKIGCPRSTVPVTRCTSSGVNAAALASILNSMTARVGMTNEQLTMVDNILKASMGD